MIVRANTNIDDVAAIIGFSATVRLIQWFGGSNIYIPGEATRNRAILRQAMERRGFTIFPTEWWHFDYQDWRKYPIMNTAFSEIP